MRNFQFSQIQLLEHEDFYGRIKLESSNEKSIKGKEVPTMTEQALRKMIAAGESTRQEFKSWVKCKDYRQRKELAVKSAVALANTKGGVLLFGVEDDGTITGCPKSDPQALMEAIYDMTRPSLFTEIEPVETSDGVVLVVSVEKSVLMLPPPAPSITDGWGT